MAAKRETRARQTRPRAQKSMSHAPSPDALERRRIRKKWHWGTFRHTVLVFFTLIFALVVMVFMVAAQFFTGPSPAGSDLLTQTLNETSALKFVPNLFMLNEYVQAALARNSMIVSDEETNVSLITVKAREPKSQEDSQSAQAQQEIAVERVVGATYRGYMMIVMDPSRVAVGVCRAPFTSAGAGLKVYEIIEKYGAIAGVNGGAFEDSGGKGNGGQPLGMVYSQGQRLRGANPDQSWVVGFDQNDILHVGEFTNAQAEAIGLRDAVAFGPALVVNGEPSIAQGTGSGLNPRTAIGQRADGAVLLLVLDGRQANSLGASYADLVDIMMEYGAINACNLDGGSSTAMFYEGKQLNDGMTISDSRRLPTAWIVK